MAFWKKALLFQKYKIYIRDSFILIKSLKSLRNYRTSEHQTLKQKATNYWHMHSVTNYPSSHPPYKYTYNDTYKDLIAHLKTVSGPNPKGFFLSIQLISFTKVIHLLGTKMPDIFIQLLSKGTELWISSGSQCKYWKSWKENT